MKENMVVEQREFSGAITSTLTAQGGVDYRLVIYYDVDGITVVRQYKMYQDENIWVASPSQVFVFDDINIVLNSISVARGLVSTLREKRERTGDKGKDGDSFRKKPHES